MDIWTTNCIHFVDEIPYVNTVLSICYWRNLKTSKLKVICPTACSVWNIFENNVYDDEQNMNNITFGKRTMPFRLRYAGKTNVCTANIFEFTCKSPDLSSRITWLVRMCTKWEEMAPININVATVLFGCFVKCWTRIGNSQIKLSWRVSKITSPIHKQIQIYTKP